MAATSPDRTDPATTTTSTPLRRRHQLRPPQPQCIRAISTRPPPSTVPPRRRPPPKPPSPYRCPSRRRSQPLAGLTPLPTTTAPSLPQRRHPNRAHLDTAPPSTLAPFTPLSHLEAGHPPSLQSTPVAVLTPSPTTTAPSSP
ncbi:hypothetical protein EDB84DRAFT_1445702 [Lactarius hengduanensis]|nr:hypothetical protein EDB84DRAFT_1445702 [Lactarius hengduanensis]